MKELFIDEPGISLKAMLYLPKTDAENPPLMIYLHGAGERGSNITHIFRHAIPQMIEEGTEIPAIVLCPQCPAEYVWNNVVVELKKLIDLIVRRYDVSRDRICITGSSMGGFGTWEMGLTYRNFFSAIAPVAGGGLSWRCDNLKTTPVIAYHGTADDVVPIVYSELMTDAVNNAGGSAQLTRLEQMGHNDGIEYAYRNTDLIERLLSMRRTDFAYVPEVLEEMF